MFSTLGWINATTFVFIFLFGSILGIYVLYQSKKLNARLLSYMGVFIFFAGFTYLGVIIDFFSILLTGDNMDNTHGLNGLLSWMWVPITVICALYLGVELMIPKFKRLVLITSTILGIIYEILLFLDPLGSLVFVYPEKPGEDLIDTHVIFGSPISIMAMISFVPLLIFDGFGFLYKGIISKGVVRKKFLMLSIGMFLYFTFAGIIDVLFALSNPVFAIFIRIGHAGSLWLLYLGIREEPEKSEKIPSKKEVKVEESLFRLSKRPNHITEEEISLYKEKKICLVCKGKAEKFNIYICSKCDTLYCQNCARTLSELENMCWMCGEPIDESKPVRPYKEEEEEVKIETSEEAPKKPKINGFPSIK